MNMSRDILLLALIDPDPEQPRRHFDPVRLAELAQSMAANGLAVPILVRPEGERYVIVHGERRYRAALSLGWETIPANVQAIDPDRAHWLALIENIQRADLTPIEEARAYQARLDGGLTQAELGKRIGKSQSAIAQKLRLLKMPDPLGLLIDRGALSEGHARQLLRLEGMYHGMTGTLNVAGAQSEHLLSTGKEARWLISGYLVQLRPQDQPVVPPVPQDDGAVATIAEACTAFDRWLWRQHGMVPLWGITAFWFACAVVTWRMSVANLQVALDLWHERFLAAVFWRTVLHPERLRPSATEDQRIEWWAWWSDLKHAVHAPPGPADAFPEALRIEAFERCMAAESLPLPTSMQDYGAHADVGRRVHHYTAVLQARDELARTDQDQHPEEVPE